MSTEKLIISENGFERTTYKAGIDPWPILKANKFISSITLCIIMLLETWFTIISVSYYPLKMLS